MDITINAPQTESNSNSAKAMSLNNGLIWFICFVPLIGLFLENYANSATAGAFLWILVPLFMIGCSIADCKQLIKHGIDAAHLFKWVWLTPFYVYKREKLCGRERYKAIMCGFFIIAALFMNGFTQSIKIDNDYMLVSAQNSYVQSLDNFSGNSAKIIGECIASYLGEDAKWDCTKNGHNYTVTVKGKHGSDNYTISFLIVYDGFTYRKFTITDVIKNKVSLRDDEFSAVCKEIFTADKSDTDSSNEESSNSQTE